MYTLGLKKENKHGSSCLNHSHFKLIPIKMFEKF